MRLFAARGFDLVIGVGFIFSSDVDRVASATSRGALRLHRLRAAARPARPPNVAGLVFREEEGSFLVGAVAGLISKTEARRLRRGHGYPAHPQVRGRVRRRRPRGLPDCAVHVAYAGTTPDAFRDPVKGKALAIGEITAGADVLYHASGTTGHGVFEAAHDVGASAIGVDSDQYDEMPGTVVTSMIKRADVRSFDTVRAVTEERGSRAACTSSASPSGAIDYVHEGPHAALLPPDVVARVERLRDDLASGRVHAPSE